MATEYALQRNSDGEIVLETENALEIVEYVWNAADAAGTRDITQDYTVLTTSSTPLSKWAAPLVPR